MIAGYAFAGAVAMVFVLVFILSRNAIEASAIRRRPFVVRLACGFATATLVLAVLLFVFVTALAGDVPYEAAADVLGISIFVAGGPAIAVISLIEVGRFIRADLEEDDHPGRQ